MLPFLHKEGVRRLFDGLALEYVSEREQQPGFRAQKALVLEMLRGAGKRILDVGCGPALLEAELLRRGHEVVGIDMSIEMLRHGLGRLASAAGRERCRLLPGDVERLEFADGAFDALVCMGVLEYLPTYARALKEIHRVVRPGGVVVLTIPDRVGPYHLRMAAVRLAKRLLRRPGPSFIPNRCIPFLLDRQLAANGLAVGQSARCGAQYVLKAIRGPA